MLEEELRTYYSEMLSKVEEAVDISELSELKVSLFGKKSYLTGLLKSLSSMSGQERQSSGALINRTKSDLIEIVAKYESVLKQANLEKKLSSQSLDVTLPSLEQNLTMGRIHPISQVLEEITVIFADMGFCVEEGPDIETDFYNFSALNIPESHPARQMHDTFYFEPDADGHRHVLRTHTSPVQIRTMENTTPPFRFIAPGRTYRCDSDQTHTPMFHQIEGVVIDKDTHLGHLKWVLESFLSAFFEVDRVNIRMRPSYFPFTEPSIEIDVQCHREGNQLHIGQGEDWMEILGCGMIHKNVLSAVGIDSEVYQGFAFGMGVDRLAMLKYGISDLRAFFNSDLRWLKHYGFSALNIPSLAAGLTKREGI